MKVGIYIKLEQSVLEYFKVAGPGYQNRINESLLEMISSKDKLQSQPDKAQRAVAHAQVAFEKYFTRAFWHMRNDAIITQGLLPVVISGLKRYGGKDGFNEAAKICRLMNYKS